MQRSSPGEHWVSGFWRWGCEIQWTSLNPSLMFHHWQLSGSSFLCLLLLDIQANWRGSRKSPVVVLTLCPCPRAYPQQPPWNPKPAPPHNLLLSYTSFRSAEKASRCERSTCPVSRAYSGMTDCSPTCVCPIGGGPQLVDPLAHGRTFGQLPVCCLLWMKVSVQEHSLCVQEHLCTRVWVDTGFHFTGIKAQGGQFLSRMASICFVP